MTKGLTRFDKEPGKLVYEEGCGLLRNLIACYAASQE
jgi:hypothetical protein